MNVSTCAWPRFFLCVGADATGTRIAECGSTERDANCCADVEAMSIVVHRAGPAPTNEAGARRALHNRMQAGQRAIVFPPEEETR